MLYRTSKIHFLKLKTYTFIISFFEFFFVDFQPCIIVKKVACDELFLVSTLMYLSCKSTNLKSESKTHLVCVIICAQFSTPLISSFKGHVRTQAYNKGGSSSTNSRSRLIVMNNEHTKIITPSMILKEG